jgi:hypothetical protein
MLLIKMTFGYDYIRIKLEERTMNQPLFISMAAYGKLMGISEGLVRKQVAAGEVRSIKQGRRTLIPHDESQRQYDLMNASFSEGDAA